MKTWITWEEEASNTVGNSETQVCSMEGPIVQCSSAQDPEGYASALPASL